MDVSPRVAAVGAVVAAVAVLIGGAWDATAYADGGASARSQTAMSAPDDSGATAQAYAQRILRALADRHTNNWVRYWRAHYACDMGAAYARRGDGLPIDRVLLTLTSAICARMDARLRRQSCRLRCRAAMSARRAWWRASRARRRAIPCSSYLGDTNNAYLIDPLGRVAHDLASSRTISPANNYYARKAA